LWEEGGFHPGGSGKGFKDNLRPSSEKRTMKKSPQFTQKKVGGVKEADKMPLLSTTKNRGTPPKKEEVF